MLCWPSYASVALSLPAIHCGASCGARGLASKKTVLAAEQDRPDVARRRHWWKRYQRRIDPARLVFIDETWAKTNMTRTHGWHRRGEPRCRMAVGAR